MHVDLKFAELIFNMRQEIVYSCSVILVSIFAIIILCSFAFYKILEINNAVAVPIELIILVPLFLMIAIGFALVLLIPLRKLHKMVEKTKPIERGIIGGNVLAQTLVKLEGKTSGEKIFNFAKNVLPTFIGKTAKYNGMKTDDGDFNFDVWQPSPGIRFPRSISNTGELIIGKDFLDEEITEQKLSELCNAAMKTSSNNASIRLFCVAKKYESIFSKIDYVKELLTKLKFPYYIILLRENEGRYQTVWIDSKN